MIRTRFGGGAVEGPDELDALARHLEAGGLLVYPTETVYGVGGAATAEVVERIRALKGRGEEAPLLVLLPAGADPRDAPKRWGLDWPDGARLAAAGLWPGPITMVLSDQERRFPSGIRSSAGGVAVRVSSHPFVRALMERWDAPLVSTSANVTGAEPARSADEATGALRGAPGGDDLWMVDAGTLPPSPPSSVVDFMGPRPVLLREGALPFGELARRVPGLQR
jgi:tRNA threonylcarbamoyl adenosine modification protein (Sua5/YciO/YrdC/YwlC family)